MKANVNIQVALRNGITCLAESYSTPPFKVANITEDKKANTLQLMLMCSSPGILDGDDYNIQVVIAAGCHLRLHTQSYQRLFTMQTGARQQFDVRLKDNSSFTWLPHPSVPHERSNFTAVNKIYLANSCTLLWGEVLTCGRQLSGEVFTCSKYHNITDVYINNRLAIKENLLVQPALTDVMAMGQLEGYTHQASFIFLNEQTSINDLGAMVNDYLQLQPAISFGITTPVVNGMLVRLLGYKAEQLYNCLKAIEKIIAAQHAITLSEAKPVVHAR
jgi:urease accessory protein